jgi:hypothetical protein
MSFTVRFENAAGEDLFLGDFAIIPKPRLVLFESIAKKSRDVVARHKDASRNVSRSFDMRPALDDLGDSISKLEKGWDIPK